MAILKAMTTVFIGMTLVSNAAAWQEPTHERIVVDALKYMGSAQASADEKRAYDLYVAAAGSFDQAASELSKAVSDVDRFEDTRLGSWWSGYSHAPLFGVFDNLINYTSYWHFLNLTRGKDVHGNDHGGYDFRYHTKDESGTISDIDTLAELYLRNDALKKADYDSTEKRYRAGSSSSYNQYKDFQTIPFQPIDHLGTYWFNQFKYSPSLQMIGHSLHAVGDAAQPHHVYVTSGNKHGPWETWVEDNYVNRALNNFSQVNTLLSTYNAQDSFADIILQTGNIAYEYPEVLTDETEATRLRVSKTLIPVATAATVIILTKGINVFFGEGGQ